LRTLSGTLTAAQKTPASLPYPKVEALDRVAGLTRLNWTRFYTGAEADAFHAAAMPADGSLIRLRIDATNLYRQRVASPGAGSDYATWASWGVTAYAVAVCAYGAAVFAFRVGLDGKLYRADSADSGATWGAWVDMGAITGTSSTRLACCCKSATLAIVLYSEANAVYRRRLSAGTWEAAAAWTNSVASITGLAVRYQGDWNVVVCGTEPTTLKPFVWTCVYGDGYSAGVGEWSALAELTRAESASGVSFACPCLDFPDVFRSFFVEAYSGSEAYARPCWTHSLATADFVSNLWREPVPFNLTSTYGLALCHSSTYVWLTRPDAVWRAPLTPASVDLTADVLLLTTALGEASGELSLSLRNDDGRYNTLGTGTYAALKLGSEILFSPGYRTAAGIEVSAGQAYWVTGWEYISLGAKSVFVLRASDGWAMLERWKAKRQYTSAAGAKNVFQLLNWLHARAGLEFSSFSTSSAIVNLYPAFTINPGESGKTVIQRLLSFVPDVLFFRGNTAYVVNPLAADASAYTYGTTHPILEGRYVTRSKESNRVQVFGSSVFTEDFDWGEIDLITDLLTQVKDLNLATTTRAHERGAAELRESAIHALGGIVLVPLNCGQELYDVVDLTDAVAGLTVAKRRVLSLSHVYNPTKGQYILKIGLGAV
jgi:hypothetical protein